jgi:SAM-dependent methyltransferase
MADEKEVERLKLVYRRYRQENRHHTHWSAANRGNQAILEHRTRVLEHLLRAAGMMPLTSRQILEIGCGSGGELSRLRQFGAEAKNLIGVDLQPESVEAARRQHPELRFEVGNGERLSFPNAQFDLVVCSTVFSSILAEGMAQAVVREISRVLVPGGTILWYDFRFNNPWNPQVKGMSRAAIRQLFPGFEPVLRSVTLLPPLARRLGPLTDVLYPALAAIPLLRTHYVGLLHRTGIGLSPARR